jgi:hypothetical protein
MSDSVSRHAWFPRRLALLPAVLAAVACSACSEAPPADLADQIPGPQVARQSLEKCLDEWKARPSIERTVSTPRPLLFVDQQRQPGQRLREYEILGDTEFEGSRRFMVRLTLDNPEESLVAHYYVFGRDPIWVYRGEDFDMLMHMDHRLAAQPSRAGSPEGAPDDAHEH